MTADILQSHDVERMVADARSLGLVDDAYVPASAGPAWQAEAAAGGPPLPPLVSLRADQTPNKHQQGRGTCYAFATAAAMEAAINRRYGRLVDLSEQYLFQVYKTSDAQGPREVSKGVFDTNSSLWGFQGNSNCVEAATRMAVPVEGAAPYLDQPELEWLRASIAAANPAPMGDLAAFTGQRQLDEVEWSAGVVPLAARHQAEYRVTAFHQVGAASLDVMSELAAGREVVMDIPDHCLLVIGYDTVNSAWEIKNSWSDTAPIWVAWGTPLANFKGGYAIDGVELVVDSQPHAAWLGRWRLRIGAQVGELVLHRFTDRNLGLGTVVALDGEATATRLGRATLDGEQRDVNGWLTTGGTGMVLFVAPDAEPTTPGARVGTRYEVALEPGWMRASGASPAGGETLTMLRPEAVTPGYGDLSDLTDLGLRNVGAQPALVSWSPERLDVLAPAAEGFGHGYYGADGWAAWERLGGSMAQVMGPGRAVSAATWGPDRLDVFMAGEDGQLQHAWHDGPVGWGQWDDLGGGIEPGQAVGAISRSRGRLEVFAISSYGPVVKKFYEPAVGWSEWRPIEEIPSRRLVGGISAAADPGGIWLASVDAATRRPLLRRFDLQLGWDTWVELSRDATVSLPAVVTTENQFQLLGKPATHSPHVMWLPAAAAGPPELRYTTRTAGTFSTSAIALSGAVPKGVAAASWGPSRLDVVVTLQSADGDLYSIRSLDHLWSGDAGLGFGIETLDIY
jgi:hypothetical protein